FTDRTHARARAASSFREATRPVGARCTQGRKETGFSLVEALRVERILQVQVGAVEVVTELVEERPQEGAVGHDLAALGGPHPEGDAVPAAAVRRQKEANASPPPVRAQAARCAARQARARPPPPAPVPSAMAGTAPCHSPPPHAAARAGGGGTRPGATRTADQSTPWARRTLTRGTRRAKWWMPNMTTPPGRARAGGGRTHADRKLSLRRRALRDHRLARACRPLPLLHVSQGQRVGVRVERFGVDSRLPPRRRRRPGAGLRVVARQDAPLLPALRVAAVRARPRAARPCSHPARQPRRRSRRAPGVPLDGGVEGAVVRDRRHTAPAGSQRLNAGHAAAAALEIAALSRAT